MSKKILLALFVIIGALFYAGCSRAGQPVYNVVNAPIESESKLTQAQVGQAIIRAGAGLGWRMSKAKDGLIVATLNARSHVAVVEIKYNSSTYSINYKDSTNLDYNGLTIHNNYNGWIQRLDLAIKNNLLY